MTLWLGLAGFLIGSLSAAGPTVDPLVALKISRAGAGVETPAFSLNQLDGSVVRSQDLAGKVLLLNFWATWCGPCKEEMPSLDRLRRQFDPREFVLLAVTADRQRDGIKAFLKHLGLDIPVLFDEGQEVSAAFMVRGLPTTVLIGKDGKTVGRAVGPRAWDSPEAVALVSSLVRQ
ncbi:MAG: TlpA disulfide reductase family protein [Nitrospirota bacterium]